MKKRDQEYFANEYKAFVESGNHYSAVTSLTPPQPELNDESVEQLQNRRRRIRSSNKNQDVKFCCAWCSVTSTPERRRGPDNTMLCNACGLQYQNKLKALRNLKNNNDSKVGINNLINHDGGTNNPPSASPKVQEKRSRRKLDDSIESSVRTIQETLIPVSSSESSVRTIQETPIPVSSSESSVRTIQETPIPVSSFESSVRTIQETPIPVSSFESSVRAIQETLIPVSSSESSVRAIQETLIPVSSSESSVRTIQEIPIPVSSFESSVHTINKTSTRVLSSEAQVQQSVTFFPSSADTVRYRSYFEAIKLHQGSQQKLADVNLRQPMTEPRLNFNAEALRIAERSSLTNYSLPQMNHGLTYHQFGLRTSRSEMQQQVSKKRGSVETNEENLGEKDISPQWKSSSRG